MVEAILGQASLLKKIVDCIKDLVSDANFQVTPTGVSLNAMDSSHVSLVTLNLLAEGFDHFQCTVPRTLGLKTESLSKIMKCSSKSDSVTLRCEKDSDTLSLFFEAPKTTQRSHFGLKLIDIDSEPLGVPETNYGTVIRLPTATFTKICQDLSITGDTISIKTSEKMGVSFSSKNDMAEGKILLEATPPDDDKTPENESVSLKVDEPVELSFALRYLVMFCKAAPLSSHVLLKLSQDVPLAVEYPLSMDKEDGDSRSLGTICYYLAPKIDDQKA